MKINGNFSVNKKEVDQIVIEASRQLQKDFLFFQGAEALSVDVDFPILKSSGQLSKKGYERVILSIKLNSTQPVFFVSPKSTKTLRVAQVENGIAIFTTLSGGETARLFNNTVKGSVH
ncbi:hypothetical protein PPHE_a3587 [Pseudoalteromonas phenolica O-BC30]|nr:hypothetical protein [Pseudoalteromonas phenolica O-BC30]